MAKPFTESADYVYQWLSDTNRISENLGDPVNVYVDDGSYATHNIEYPSFLINTTPYTHDSLEQNAVVRSLNDLNDRKVQRSGDIVTGNFRVNQNVIVDLDLMVQGGDIISSASSFNLLLDPTSVSAFLAATTVGIGAASGTTTINHDLSVNGGDLLTSQSTFNLLNTTATTVNAFGAATSINIGAATGLTTINHSVLIKGGADQTFAINDGTTSIFSVDSVNGNTLISGTLGTTGDGTFLANLNVNGNLTTASSTFNLINTTATTVNAFGAATALNMGNAAGVVTIAGDLGVNGGDLSTTSASATLFNATATTVSIAGAATTLAIGNTTSGTQTVNMFTSSTDGGTYNFATGPSATGITKTLNIGTGGTAGSTSNINFGSASGGTVIFNAPSLRINTASNGVIHTTSSNGSVGVLATATANKMLLSGASAAPTWSIATYPSASPTANSLLFAKTANTFEAMQFISSDSSLSFDYTVSGKINLTTTGAVPSSVVITGDQTVGSNKTGTYSQTGTSTITIDVVAHGMSTGNWIYLDFTSGAGVDGVYQVTVTSPDTFTVQAAVQTTNGNVTASIGGATTTTKVLTVGTGMTDVNTSLFVKSYDATQITNLIKVQDSLGNDKLIVDPTGKTTINGDLHVQGNIVNTGSSGAVVTQGIVENPVTTTSTTETTILSISAAIYRSVEFQIQAVEGTKFWTSKILAIHDGTNVNWTEYGMAGIGTSPLSGYAVDISAGNILLKVTSASAANTTYKVVATAILA